MKSKQKQTATPWKMVRHGSRLVNIVDEKESPILALTCEAGSETEANGNLIVKAVNSHDALINAVKLLSALVAEEGESYDALLEAEWDSAAHQEREPSTAKIKADAMKTALAALKLAGA